MIDIRQACGRSRMAGLLPYGLPQNQGKDIEPSFQILLQREEKLPPLQQSVVGIWIPSTYRYSNPFLEKGPPQTSLVDR